MDNRLRRLSSVPPLPKVMGPPALPPAGAARNRRGHGYLARPPDIGWHEHEYLRHHAVSAGRLGGLVGGALVLIAAARRGGLIAENTLTHAIAPPASALTLFTLTGLYLYQRDRVGRLGLAG